MIETNKFEEPKLALIRLLKSQGCCKSQELPKMSSQFERMLKYKQELQMKVVQQRSKLNEIPCAITLAQEIQQLQEVVNGLGRQNRGRMQHLRKLKQKYSQTNAWEVGQSQEQIEHERLQQQYASLMRTLQATNENNRRLVERLTRW